MTAQPQPENHPITVDIDPRVAYAGFGPDDGELAQAANRCENRDAMEDLADAAEQLDFTYLRAWEAAAKRIAPQVEWSVSAQHHQRSDEKPLSPTVAVAVDNATSPLGESILNEINAAITVDSAVTVDGRTRWSIQDGERMVGSTSIPWTVHSIQDQYIASLADRIDDSGDLLRTVEQDGLRLRLFEPTGEMRAEHDALAYVLTDEDTVIFAGFDFHPSPLHAIDSDRTIEALAEFLALQRGDTDSEYFAGYTETQLEWIDGDGPNRLQELTAALPSDTEYSRQMTVELGATMTASVRLWDVAHVDRSELPAGRILANSADNARAQYPGFISAWLFDNDRDVIVDDDLFTDLTVELADTGGPFTLRQARGQASLDWAVAHVNHWQTEAVIPINNSPADMVLNIPATGSATVAVRNSVAVAHAGARVDAHYRAHIAALAGSHVEIHPGAYVDRRPGSCAHVVTAQRSALAHTNPERGLERDRNIRSATR